MSKERNIVYTGALSYVGVDFNGALPLCNSDFKVMPSGLYMTWANALLMAVF